MAQEGTSARGVVGVAFFCQLPTQAIGMRPGFLESLRLLLLHTDGLLLKGRHCTGASQTHTHVHGNHRRSWALDPFTTAACVDVLIDVALLHDFNFLRQTQQPLKLTAGMTLWPPSNYHRCRRAKLCSALTQPCADGICFPLQLNHFNFWHCKYKYKHASIQFLHPQLCLLWIGLYPHYSVDAQSMPACARCNLSSAWLWQ